MLDTSTYKYYAAGRGDNIMAILDMANPVSAVMKEVREGPWDVCDNPNESKVYCANRYENRVSVIDADNDTTIATLTTGQYPVGLACNTIDNKIYSVNFWGSNVTVIDGNNNHFLGNIPVGNGPYDILYNPTDNKIYSIDYSNNTVTIIDAAEDTVITTVTVKTHSAMAITARQVIRLLKKYRIGKIILYINNPFFRKYLDKYIAFGLDGKKTVKIQTWSLCFRR